MFQDAINTIKNLCKNRETIRSISFDLHHEIITVTNKQDMMSFTFEETDKCLEYIEKQP